MRLHSKGYGGAEGQRQKVGFTLIEVMVASVILVAGLAGILMICSNGLRTARILDRVHVDAGSLASVLSLLAPRAQQRHRGVGVYADCGRLRGGSGSVGGQDVHRVDRAASLRAR